MPQTQVRTMPNYAENGRLHSAVLGRLFTRLLTFQRQGLDHDSADAMVDVPVTGSDRFHQLVTNCAENRRFSAGAVLKQGA